MNRINFLVEAHHATEADFLDADGDGLRDGLEDAVDDCLADTDGDPGTPDEFLADTDGDGIRDGMEPRWWQDTDGDGQINACDHDSDDDGLWDGWEDWSGEGIYDGGEPMGEGNYRTNPLLADTDGDGLTDLEEVELPAPGWWLPYESDTENRFGTPEFDMDADGLGAGLWNGPNDPDSDGDGLWDGWHDDGGAVWEPGETLGEWGDPGAGGDGGFGTLPWDTDTDDDGLWDGWDDRGCDGDIATVGEAEENNGQWDACEGRGETGEPATEQGGAFTAVQLGEDADGDGTNNGPLDDDSDDDGLKDGEEVLGTASGYVISSSGFVYRTSPVLADTDDDGLNDRMDPVPLDDDMDGDGFLNYMDDDMDGDGGTNFFWDDDDDNDGMTDAYETEHGVSVGGWQDPARHNQRYALIIGFDSNANGVNDRRSWNGLYWLRVSLVDDHRFVDDDAGGFDASEDHIAMLYYNAGDSSSGYSDDVDASASLASVAAAFAQIQARMTKNDFFLLVYLGHAGMQLQGIGESLTIAGDLYPGYGGWLREQIEKVNYRRSAIVIQNCNAGFWIHSQGNPFAAIPGEKLLAGPDRIVLTASDNAHLSMGDDNWFHSLDRWYFFTGFLEKLRERADLMSSFQRGVEFDQNGRGPGGPPEPANPQLDDDGDGVSQESEFAGEYSDLWYDPAGPLSYDSNRGHRGFSYWEDEHGSPDDQTDDTKESYNLAPYDGNLAAATYL